jgi:hypothetical protein
VYHFGEPLDYDIRNGNVGTEGFRRRAGNREEGPRGRFGLVTKVG